MEEVAVKSQLAHEIKNPLSIIKMNVDVLCATIEDEASTKKLLLMKNEVNKIDNIIKRYLDFTKNNDSTKDYIYIKDVIRNIIKENTITYPKVLINLYCDDDDISVIGYEYHINMIFSNLIKNSVEAIKCNSCEESKQMSFQGEGNIPYGEINISITQQDGIGIISIQDNGVGIKKEDENNILDNFYTTKKEGSGIGLTIVKNIVKIYNGYFLIKNNEDKGVTATVKIPIE